MDTETEIDKLENNKSGLHCRVTVGKTRSIYSWRGGGSEEALFSNNEVYGMTVALL